MSGTWPEDTFTHLMQSVSMGLNGGGALGESATVGAIVRAVAREAGVASSTPVKNT